MGMDLITALKLHIADGQVNAVETKLPSEFSHIKGFVHKVKIDSSVPPVRQRLRRLPYSVRVDVAREIKRMLDDGIIEKIEASPWVSPLVVTVKKDGGIRVCCDLREPNKAVVVPSYPRSVIDELFAELQAEKT